MTDKELLSGALKRARLEKMSGIDSDKTRLADALSEAVEALRHTDAAFRVLRTAVKKGIPNLPDSRLWGSATDRLEANTEILAKYQEGK